MFQCSNYSRVWSILTSYYDKVTIYTLRGRMLLVMAGEHFRGGRGQVYREPGGGSEGDWEVPPNSAFLHKTAFHQQWWAWRGQIVNWMYVQGGKAILASSWTGTLGTAAWAGRRRETTLRSARRPGPSSGRSTDQCWRTSITRLGWTSDCRE